MSQPTSDKLLSARLKVERAKQHIADLEVATRAFLDSNPYEVRAKDDPQTGQLVYEVVSVRDASTCIPLAAGEAIQQLRSALDHLAYQLFQTGAYLQGVKEREVYFPIFETSKAKSEFLGTRKGTRKDVIDTIDEIEPYKGGKGHRLWVLNRLNNIDKHRQLLVAGAGVLSQH